MPARFEKGGTLLLLPGCPLGEPNHLQVPGALAPERDATTLLKCWRDLVDALSRAGDWKMVLLNGHGG